MKYLIVALFFAVLAALLGVGVNALFTVFLFLPMATGYVAWARGHHPLPWVLAGLVIPLLPLYAVILIPQNKAVVKQRYGKYFVEKEEKVAAPQTFFTAELKAA